MSTWYVNSAWTTFFAEDEGPVILVDCSETDAAFAIDTRDALSVPQVSTLLPGGLALWPRGAAWGTPDGEAPSTGSVIAGLTRALLAPFADLYALAWQLTEESRSATLVDSLEDWERDFRLPDPCVTQPQSEGQRRSTLRARVLAPEFITPADMVRLAARLGYVVALEEPDAFAAGTSTCGSYAEPSDTALEQQWVVQVHDAPLTEFEAGIGEAGVTRLLDFEHDALECAIRRISPAWTIVVFSYARRPGAYRLVTEDGDVLVTETETELIAPALLAE